MTSFRTLARLRGDKGPLFGAKVGDILMYRKDFRRHQARRGSPAAKPSPGNAGQGDPGPIPIAVGAPGSRLRGRRQRDWRWQAFPPGGAVETRRHLPNELACRVDAATGYPDGEVKMPQSRRHDMGAGGNCICPRCDHRIPHTRGVACQEERCPECGTKMLREGSHHHRLLEEKRAKQGTE
jgi:hypothetical protein